MSIEKNVETIVSDYLTNGKIEDKIKSLMIPIIENANFDNYVVKLESVLAQVLKETTMDNTKILENFQSIATGTDVKEIKLSELFQKWCEYVAKNVETSDLEVEYDDQPLYETVDVNFYIDYEEDRSWSSFEHAVVCFVCDQDDEMNVVIRISRYKSDNNWAISVDTSDKISHFKSMNQFDIFLLNLSQNRTDLNIDEDYGSEEVQPEEEPEAYFS